MSTSGPTATHQVHRAADDGAGGAEFGLVPAGKDRRVRGDPAVLRLRRPSSRSGRIGISWARAPDRIADGIGDHGDHQHGHHFADADAAAEHVVEPALVEVHVDQRRVGDPGHAVVVEARRQYVAGTAIDFAALVEGVAQPFG